MGVFWIEKMGLLAGFSSMVWGRENQKRFGKNYRPYDLHRPKKWGMIGHFEGRPVEISCESCVRVV
jgi:hypothetical protein